MLQEKDVPQPRIKIIDFGLARRLQDGVTFKSLCGTPQYIGGSPGGLPDSPSPGGSSEGTPPDGIPPASGRHGGDGVVPL